MQPGQAEKRTHDYVRHGTTTLVRRTRDRHRRGHPLRPPPPPPRHRVPQIPEPSTRRSPTTWTSTSICDNYATHKTDMINAWLGRHPRFHVHFTPTGSSWLNQVERLFGLITDKLIRRGVHAASPLSKPTSGNGSTLERGPETLHLDQNRRRNPQLARKISGAHFRRDTLDRFGSCGCDHFRYWSRLLPPFTGLVEVPAPRAVGSAAWWTTASSRALAALFRPGRRANGVRGGVGLIPGWRLSLWSAGSQCLPHA